MIRSLRQQQAISIYATILLLCNIAPTEIAEHVLLFSARRNSISKKELKDTLKRLLLLEADRNISHIRGIRK